LHIPILLPRTKKGLIIALAVVSAIFLGLAIFAYFDWQKDYHILQEKGRPDFNTLTEDQLEAGMSVHGDIDLALGAYAESYETDLGITHIRRKFKPLLSDSHFRQGRRRENPIFDYFPR